MTRPGYSHLGPEDEPLERRTYEPRARRDEEPPVAKTMSPEAQRIAIAEACGWRKAFPSSGSPHPETKRGGILLPYNWVNGITHERAMELPDYLSDLNAMHEAEKVLTNEQAAAYRARLADLFSKACGYEWDDGYAGAIFATATKRAEAFCRTIGKWDSAK